MVRKRWYQSSPWRRDEFRPSQESAPWLCRRDLSNICATLEKAGFPTISDEPLEGYSRKYVSDPFGNRIELMQIVAD